MVMEMFAPIIPRFNTVPQQDIHETGNAGHASWLASSRVLLRSMATPLSRAKHRLALAAALLAALSISASTTTARAQSWSAEKWQQNLKTWRTQREAEISAPDGWLTLVSLDWLNAGTNTVGSAADNTLHLPAKAPAHLGVLAVIGSAGSDRNSSAKPEEAATVKLSAPEGGFPPGFSVGGKPAHEGPLRTDESDASTMRWRGFTLLVIERGDRFMLRVKDADSPVRTSFKGLNWYAPDPRYRVTAQWIPYNPPRTEKIATVIGTTLELPAPGVARFTLDGKIMELVPVIEEPGDKELFFMLRDHTSRTATYGGGRFLYTAFPDHGLNRPGTLVLDFNKLHNPPCAYTEYATCPLPPRQNQLDTEIPAGEKRYHE
jgi:uncharacterized protein (DUF1684 family)